MKNLPEVPPVHLHTPRSAFHVYFFLLFPLLPTLFWSFFVNPTLSLEFIFLLSAASPWLIYLIFFQRNKIHQVLQILINVILLFYLLDDSLFLWKNWLALFLVLSLLILILDSYELIHMSLLVYLVVFFLVPSSRPSIQFDISSPESLIGLSSTFSSLDQEWTHWIGNILSIDIPPGYIDAFLGLSTQKAFSPLPFFLGLALSTHGRFIVLFDALWTLSIFIFCIFFFEGWLVWNASLASGDIIRYLWNPHVLLAFFYFLPHLPTRLAKSSNQLGYSILLTILLSFVLMLSSEVFFLFCIALSQVFFPLFLELIQRFSHNFSQDHQSGNLSWTKTTTETSEKKPQQELFKQ